MINTDDEKALRALYTEMNIGFVAPQNGGVSGQSVAIIQAGVDGQPGEEDNKDVGCMLNSVIDDLNHLKMDIDQGCRGDAQIDSLQACCDTLAKIIENIGNTSSSQYQNGAFAGALDTTGSTGDNDGSEMYTM
jgi:hypothetical protein